MCALKTDSLTSRALVATPLCADWLLTSSAPDEIASPSQFAASQYPWVPATVPGTVAQALEKAGQWDIDADINFDDKDWWFRCTFPAEKISRETHDLLRFDGLATLAEVWLNGTSILKSENMFQQHELDVTGLLQSSNELVICFRALTAALSQRRPRPRWKTKLVSQQQLRWIRTSLLGRIPGWSPPVAPVGPWGAVTLQRREQGTPFDIDLCSFLEGTAGVVEFSCKLDIAPSGSVSGRLLLGDVASELRLERHGDHGVLSGQLRYRDVALWWPHTHGAPVLHACTAEIINDGNPLTLDFGRIGFRRVELRDEGSSFELRINGSAVFCRGACWTINDIVSLRGDRQTLARDLHLARDAGMNMVRIGGTMVYEDDAVYDLCDELGILVWQDFMFANMDYPIDDPAFRASVTAEATQQLRRLRKHACVAMYCGNSEVEQQAAMLGMPREVWRSPLFSELLPSLCERWHPGVPYVASTPSGGVMPFHVGTGITHYYGVGAYLRPITDVRRAGVRFTPECLGFSNVPETDVIDALMRGESPAPHDPRWKRRVPRDSGAGWDFEDVRDHYLGQLFAADPVELRCFDMNRYLMLSRVTTGEMMAQVYSEWRSAHSHCGGALVWFFKDLWPGAGWGILDSRGIPKACFYYLRRVWQPRAVLLTNEGLDGIHIHVVNETDAPLVGQLELVLLRAGRVVVANVRVPCEVAPKSKLTLSADSVLGGFYDVAYAYRFGPPKHDVVAATLLRNNDEEISGSFCFPESPGPTLPGAGSVTAEAQRVGENTYKLTLLGDTFLYATHIDANGFLPDDNYFHLMPGRQKEILLTNITGGPAALKGYIEAPGLIEAVRIVVKE